MVLCPDISLVSIDAEAPHDFPSRDARTLASGRLSTLLALEIVLTGRRPQIDTELRVLIRRMSVENPLWGAPRIHGELLKLGFEVAQSSVAKYMVKRRGPPARDGEPSCVTTRRTLPPWTCSLFQRSVSTCSMPSSSSGSIAETSSGSTSQQIPRPNGLHVKSRRRFLGMRPRTTSSAIATGS